MVLMKESVLSLKEKTT